MEMQINQVYCENSLDGKTIFNYNNTFLCTFLFIKQLIKTQILAFYLVNSYK